MSLLSSSPGSEKRKAPDSDMGPPGKRLKRTTPLERKLDALKEILTGLRPIWKNYDPGDFMEEMRLTREQVDALTPDKVEEFISSGACTAILDALDVLDDKFLLGTPSISSQPIQRSDSHQKMRNHMIAFVQRVRESLNGQS